METVIVICLVIIIVLLLHDKVSIGRRKEHTVTHEKPDCHLPDIMGKAKPLRSYSMPKSSMEFQYKNREEVTDNFAVEIAQEVVNVQTLHEEPKDVFRNLPDLEQEEEEWNSNGIYGGDDGFAQGVTFEELSSVGMLLQKNNLEPSQKQIAIALVQKIQGTELFNLLENSMESASRKIADLLDGSLSSENGTVSTILLKNEWNDFDIGDFV